MKSHKYNHIFNETAFGSGIGGDAPAPPQSPNEGGTAASEYATASQSSTHPRLVIRGESFNHYPTPAGGESHELVSIGGKPVVIATSLPKADGNPYSAITDFLNCTFSYKSPDIELLFFDLAECLGHAFTPFTNRYKGLHGWKNSIQLGESKNFLAYGGQNNTVFLSIPGEGCHMIPSWQRLVSLIRDKYQGKITRWDGAVDDYEGIHTVDSAVQLYVDNQFSAGGRKPECNQHGNWIKPNGKGRTFEVGQRKNGKMIRIYEKGMQLGREWDPWVRWEVELHSIDRDIPWEVLLEPGKYVAGAYPNALGWVHEDMRRIKTIQKTTEISYESQKHYAKLAYGKLINTMLEIEGSAENVMKELQRDGIPKALNLPIVADNEGWAE